MLNLLIYIVEGNFFLDNLIKNSVCTCISISIVPESHVLTLAKVKFPIFLHFITMF